MARLILFLILGIPFCILVELSIIYFYKKISFKFILPVGLTALTIINLVSHFLVEFSLKSKPFAILDFYNITGLACGGWNTDFNINYGILTIAYIILLLLVSLIGLWFIKKNTEKINNLFITCLKCFLPTIPVIICVLFNSFGLLFFNRLTFFFSFRPNGF